MKHVPACLLTRYTRVHRATASMTETGNAPQIRIYIKIEKIPEQSITINKFLILDLDCLELQTSPIRPQTAARFCLIPKECWFERL